MRREAAWELVSIRPVLWAPLMIESTVLSTEILGCLYCSSLCAPVNLPRLFVHMCMPVYMCVCMYVDVYVCVCVSVCIFRNLGLVVLFILVFGPDLVTLRGFS